MPCHFLQIWVFKDGYFYATPCIKRKTYTIVEVFMTERPQISFAVFQRCHDCIHWYLMCCACCINAILNTTSKEMKSIINKYFSNMKQRITGWQWRRQDKPAQKIHVFQHLTTSYDPHQFFFYFSWFRHQLLNIELHCISWYGSHNYFFTEFKGMNVSNCS